MSAITIESDLIHYEVLGRGRPVILVHGWLGSWRYWVPSMTQLSTKYRTYALDLWGFGDSGRPAGHYGLKEQVQLLLDFMDGLGITKAALVGHSFGAAVCLSFARKYPERAPRVVLVSTPLELSMVDEKLNARPSATGGISTTRPINDALAPNPLATVVKPTVNAATVPNTQTVTAIPSTPPVVPAAQPPVQAPADTSIPATNGPAATVPPSTPPVSSTSDTITRNPFRGLGETPEEILANLRKRNITASAGQSPAATSPANTAVPLTAGPSTPSPAPLSASTPVPTTPPVAASVTASTPVPTTPPVATSEAVSTPNPAASALPTPSVVPAPAIALTTQPEVPPTATSIAPVTPIAPQSVLPPTTPIASPIASTPTSPTPSTPPTPEPAKSASPVLPSVIGTLAGYEQSTALAVGRTEGPSQLLIVLTSNTPEALLTKYIDRDAPDYDKLKAELEKTDEQALIKSAQSFTNINLLNELLQLTSPTLLLHGENDKFLRPPTEETLRLFDSSKMLTNVDGRQLKHFPMLEITAKFNRLVMDFLEAPDPTSVQFKEQWRRTMR